MSEQLTALDATFLELEEADESAHMHIGAILVFDPPPGGGVPTADELRRNLGDRLDQLPRYRQRLSQPHTGGLSWPSWEPDPDFDLERHITRAALPAPGGEAELAAWSSAFFSQRLDRRRPLWEMAIVEGLAGGRWALATKTHHAMVDGVGSVDVGHLLLDTEPDAPAPEAAEQPATAGAPRPAAHGALARLARAWAGLLPGEALRTAAQAGAHAALHPRESLQRARSAVELIVREELRGAPRTSLNTPIGTLRRFEVVQVPLDDLKAVKDGLGGTVNDVVLTVCAGGLRALLVARGEEPPAGGLRAMVPMNVRAAGEHLALGNKISSLFVELPVAEGDTVRRYAETVSRSASLKSQGRQAQGTSAVIGLAGLAPPVLHASIAQALYATRLFNVTITNVPGPQQTLYAAGAPLREIRPLVPLAAEHAVGVAVVSYDGAVCFGVVADRDAVPDLDVLLDGMRAALDDLLVEAGAQNAAAG